MRIGYDLRRMQNPGIGRYMHHLVEAVLRAAPTHEYVFIVARGADVRFLDHGKTRVVETSARYYSVAEQLILPQLAREHRLDLFHSPHFLVPVLSPCPVVVTIHDCIYISCPGDLSSSIGRAYYRMMMQAAAHRSEAIITDSEFSKADIVRFLKVREDKIKVIPCGVDQRFHPMAAPDNAERVRRRYGISEEFVFYTGIYKPRKNHSCLLEAFALLRKSGVQAQLVLGGPLGSGEALLRERAKELGIERDLIFTGFIEESELPNLYSAARVYACPSTYEGFGFTVLEAMACGTPVVCHPGTSLPEVGGNAASYADACCPAEFADAVRTLFMSEASRRGRVAEGLTRAASFSWERAAKQTLELYDAVLNRQETDQCV